MCGRFVSTVTNPEVLQATFNLVEKPAEISVPRYNVAPTQQVGTVIRDDVGNHFLWMRWGLIPSWAKDPSIGNKLINARADSVATKNSFRAAFKRRRCLVVATGFYEWKPNDDGSKTPFFFGMEDQEPFGFAGLWERWTEPESGEIVTSCTLITTDANDLVKSVHNRMPVILPRTSYEEWLNPDTEDLDRLQAFLKPFPAAEMMAYPVSEAVNSPRNEGADLLKPAS